MVGGNLLVSLPDEKIAFFDDGDDKFTSFYHFKLDSHIDVTKEMELHADLAGTNGNNCEGTVAIYETEFKSPYPTP